MKLRHLLLASFAACAFASCSDDSSNGIEIPEENYQMIDANVSLTATALDGIQTKVTTEVGSGNEQFIKSLTAYLFYADNDDDATNDKFAAMKTVDAASGSGRLRTIEDIVVKVKATAAGEVSSTQLKVVIFANTALDKTPSTWGDITNGELSNIVSFADVHTSNQATYVPMFSQIVTIGGLVAGTDYDNWVIANGQSVKNTKQADIGSNHTTITKGNNDQWTEGSAYYPKENSADNISLTRHVARVQLEGLDCNFTQNYKDATFTLTDVYVANVSTKSKLYGDATAYSLEQATGPFSHGCGYIRDDYYLVEGTKSVAQFAKKITEGVSIGMTGNDHSKNMSGGEVNYSGLAWQKFSDKTASARTNSLPEMAQFYVYEYDGTTHVMTRDSESGGDNPTGNIQTLLILKGTWTNNGVVKENRYYRIPIGDGATTGVQHNNIYKVYATITGEGSKDPDTSELNACVSFSVKVQPWTVITQHEDDVN
ncbi:fimbrial protein [Parabacteroides sp.]|uniref:fimbrial protein n=1 Tax=Parabacteroides sp. TaxID=1869337 RepID=UPI00257EC251|nr:fimbrial protein [Parabacteroides sp.]